jgi:hypothetical protein
MESFSKKHFCCFAQRGHDTRRAVTVMRHVRGGDPAYKEFCKKTIDDYIRLSINF